MALPGYYLINYSDPRKEGFYIEPFQTDGSIAPTFPEVDSRARRSTTSLLLYGRDVPNYGERIAENFVQILENFAGPKAPNDAIEGQLWFDTGESYDVIIPNSNEKNALASDELLFDLTTKDIFEQIKTINGSVIHVSAPKRITAGANNTLVTQKINPINVTVYNGKARVKFTSADSSIPLNFTERLMANSYVIEDDSTYSRLRVATTVNDELKWVSVNNILTADDSTIPDVKLSEVGDQYYNTDKKELMILTLDMSGQRKWTAVGANYVPLEGNSTIVGDLTINGWLNVGANRARSSAIPDADDVLVNKKYTDRIEHDVATIDGKVVVIENTLPEKLNRNGSIKMTGPLDFGYTSGVAIKVNQNTIKGLTTSFEPNFKVPDNPEDAVNKGYLRDAIIEIEEELQAEIKKAGFIEDNREIPTYGMIPQTMFWVADGTTQALEWRSDVNNLVQGISAVQSGPLVIETTNDVVVRHNGRPANQVVFKFSQSEVSSETPLYLRAPTEVTDDPNAAELHRAACHGWVDGYVTMRLGAYVPPDIPDSSPYVTSMNFTYDIDVEPVSYRLVTLQSDGSTISTDMYHRHDAYDVKYVYTRPDEDWTQYENDIMHDYIIENSGLSFPTTSVGVMIDALNINKAPVEDAQFISLPIAGVVGAIIDYNSTNRTIRIEEDFEFDLEVGMPLYIDNSGFPAYNDKRFTIVEVTRGPDYVDNFIPGQPVVIPTTLIKVLEPLPHNGMEPDDSANVNVGFFASEEDTTSLITRGALDLILAEAIKPEYSFWKVIADGTSTVRNLGFTYAPGTHSLMVFCNGVKQRVGIITGGSFNETSPTTITIAQTYAGDEYEFYKI